MVFNAYLLLKLGVLAPERSFFPYLSLYHCIGIQKTPMKLSKPAIYRQILIEFVPRLKKHAEFGKRKKGCVLPFSKMATAAIFEFIKLV
jgi:hypothetical protein